MSVIQTEYLPFSLKLKEPFVSAHNIITERKGFYIKLSYEGCAGFGETAPLPEFGSENLQQSLIALNSFSFNNISLQDIKGDNKLLNLLLAPLSSYPAARHGLEQALLNLTASYFGISLYELLSRSDQAVVKLNATIGLLSPTKTLYQAQEYLEKGYSTIKLKAGRPDFKEDIVCITQISNLLPDFVNLRLDINGNWTLNQAMQNLAILENFRLEYIEQPVKKTEDLLLLARNSKISLAADESLRSLDDALMLINTGSVPVLILKPMMLGGILNTLKIIELAEAAQKKVIISSSLESPLGLLTSLFTASILKTNQGHGLGTFDIFENNPFPELIKVKNGAIVGANCVPNISNFFN